jgi:uncharacterized phage-associated protein
MERRRAELVQLKPNIDRVIASIAYAIDAAARIGKTVTQYEIVKSIFLADRSHLNEYGRLISSDKYVAMIHGPVPSTAYDVLKSNETTMRRYRIDSLPWRTRKGESPGVCIFYDADTSIVDDVLSPSDKAAIDAAVSTVKSLSFAQIRKLTHEDPAYIDAWEEDANRKQFPISLGMLFDVPNFERARQISEMSQIS